MRQVLFRLWAVASLIFVVGLVVHEIAYVMLWTQEELAYWNGAYSAPYVRAASRLSEVEDAEAALPEIRADYGVPMSIAVREHLPAGASEMLSDDGLVAWVFSETNEYCVVPIGDSAQYLVVGPFVWGTSRWPVRALVVGVILSVLALSFGLVMRPLFASRARMLQAVHQLAAGDLDTRVPRQDMAVLPEVAEALNRMAARTQKLVEGQRSVLRMASHELRTPISRLRLALHLQRDALRPSDRVAMEGDLDAVELLMKELLTLARLEGGGESRSRVPVRLGPVIDELIDDMRPLLDGVEISSVENHAPVVAVLPDLFSRAVSNVLSNASRYAASQIQVSLHEGEGHTEVIVDDDGPGIPESERDQVIRPFVRLDTRGQHGLGLAIVDQVMQLHEGRLELRDSPLSGLRVVLCFPR